MITGLEIKYEFVPERESPEELFEAMSLYIKAYRDFSQLLSSSMGYESEFCFQLDSIKEGSLVSSLSNLKKTLGGRVEDAIYKASSGLFSDLVEEGETKREDQIDRLANNLELRLQGSLPDQLRPYVDRKSLAAVINEFSDANGMTAEGEEVYAKTLNQEKYGEVINAGWAFTGDKSNMFLGDLDKQEHPMLLYVISSVNEGNAAWRFKSISLNRKIQANIKDKNWLERYQNGLVKPVGPKDVVRAVVKYDVFTPHNEGEDRDVKNAEVIKIVGIKRYKGYQYEC